DNRTGLHQQWTTGLVFHQQWTTGLVFQQQWTTGLVFHQQWTTELVFHQQWTTGLVFHQQRTTGLVFQQQWITGLICQYKTGGSTAFSPSTDSKNGLGRNQPILRTAPEVKANSPIKDEDSMSPQSTTKPFGSETKTGASIGTESATRFQPASSTGLSPSTESRAGLQQDPEKRLINTRADPYNPDSGTGQTLRTELETTTPLSASDNRTGYASEFDSTTMPSRGPDGIKPQLTPVNSRTPVGLSMPTTSVDQSPEARLGQSYTGESVEKKPSELDRDQSPLSTAPPSSSRPVLHIVSDASSRSRPTSSTPGPFSSGGSDIAEQHRLVNPDRWAKSTTEDATTLSKKRPVPTEGVSRIPPLRQHVQLQPSLHQPQDFRPGSPLAQRHRAQFGIAERVLLTDEETHSDSSERCFELESKPLLVTESSNANARLNVISSSSLSDRVCTRRPYSHAVWHAVSAPVDDSTTSNSSSSSCSCSDTDDDNSTATTTTFSNRRLRRSSLLSSSPNSARQLRQLSSDRLSSDCPVCRCLALLDEFSLHQTTGCSGNCQRFSNR
uniref:Uncharacterized protein n=1 Tax=Macrostomum lignano TaxID=282301 RepID=A0A1I8GI24_9PLAT